MDGEPGGGWGRRRGWKRGSGGLLHGVGCEGRGSRPLLGSTSDLRREGNVSARDRKLGPPVGWRLEVPAPGVCGGGRGRAGGKRGGGGCSLLSRLIQNSRSSRLGAYTSTSKQDLELPGRRPL